MTEPEPRKSSALKKAWGEQVKRSRDIAAYAEDGDHEAKLTDRGVSQHALDVVLCDGNSRAQECGDGTDDGDDLKCTTTLAGDLKQREETQGEEDARRDHRGRVNHGRDRGWAFHRIREPDMQRELRALANRATKNQQADHASRAEAE